MNSAAIPTIDSVHKAIRTNAAPEIVRWQDGAPVVKLHGFKPTTFPEGLRIARFVASGDNNTKQRKSNKRSADFLSCGISFAAWKASGIGNVCPNASPACIDACVGDQGMAGVFETIEYARMARTWLFHKERQYTLETIAADLTRWQRKAERADMLLCCRPNMFSDLHWEKLGIVDAFPQIQFYDYTKHPRRASAVRPNYWVTFSRSETNDSKAIETLENGANVAVVFYNRGNHAGNRAGRQTLPKTWRGFRVFNADDTDLRFTDPRAKTGRFGLVCGLKLKAGNNETRNRAIDSGFAVRALRTGANEIETL